MADHIYLFAMLSVLLLLFSAPYPSLATPRKLSSLVQQQTLLKYHRGPLLTGNTTLNLIWYGRFTSSQRSIILDFIQSLSSSTASPPLRAQPSASTWWKIAESYSGKPCTLVLGNQILHDSYPLGKSLKSTHLLSLASNPELNRKNNHNNAVNVVFTAADVAVEGFCMSRCGTHGHKKTKTGAAEFAYAWVGDSATQCPGQCAWPFHQPVYGPQVPPLVAPNGDVGVDGMIINLATVLAGTVTNPYGNGFFQGPANAPLEAVSACTGAFGSGAYPGYAGRVLVDKATGASYNADGMHGRKYLLPAMWDPKTSKCKTLV